MSANPSHHTNDGESRWDRWEITGFIVMIWLAAALVYLLLTAHA